MKQAKTYKTVFHLLSVAIATIPIFLILLFTHWTHEKIGTDSPLIIVGFFFLFVLLIQFMLVKPTIDTWKKKNKMTRDKLILFGLALSMIAGFNFGLAFGDLLTNFVSGTLTFGLFYVVNFLTYSRLTDK